MNVLWQDKKRTLFGMPLSFTRYSLDEERLCIRTGTFTIVEDEVRLYRILDVTLRQTLRQRILGIGTIHCCSSDSSKKEFSIVNIKKPREVKEMLSDMIEVQREKKHVYFHESLNTDPLNSDDISDTIHKP